MSDRDFGVGSTGRSMAAAFGLSDSERALVESLPVPSWGSVGRTNAQQIADQLRDWADQAGAALQPIGEAFRNVDRQWRAALERARRHRERERYNAELWQEVADRHDDVVPGCWYVWRVDRRRGDIEGWATSRASWQDAAALAEWWDNGSPFRVHAGGPRYTYVIRRAPDGR